MPPRRKLVERFAAHLAYVLNTGVDGVVEVQPFRLYNGVTLLLAGRGQAGIDYRDGLLGFHLAADRSAEQLAAAYFDTVLDKRMMVARAEPTHVVHGLFLILCRRATVEGWVTASLERAITLATAGSPPADFAAVSARLARLDDTLSPGNPAKSTRATKGPLWLRVGDHARVVQDELSIVKALTCSPIRQRLLAEGAEFNQLCSQMIKAVEAADAHYGALLRIGLYPSDWADAVNVNLAKAISASATMVRELAGGNLNDEAAWRGVFAKRGLPGFDDFEQFWASELGRAIRFPVLNRIAPQDESWSIEEAPDVVAEEPSEPDICDPSVFRDHLALAKVDGAVDDLDCRVMEAVYTGARFAALKKLPGVTARLNGKSWTIEAYVDDLRDRLIRWSRLCVGGLG